MSEIARAMESMSVLCFDSNRCSSSEADIEVGLLWSSYPRPVAMIMF